MGSLQNGWMDVDGNLVVNEGRTRWEHHGKSWEFQATFDDQIVLEDLNNYVVRLQKNVWFSVVFCLVYLAVNRVKHGHEMGRDEALIPGARTCLINRDCKNQN